MVKPFTPVRHQICRRAGVCVAVYIADRGRGADPLSIIRHLPAGAFVLYRDYDAVDRAAYARGLASACRKRHLPLIVAGDARLARAVKADGLHLPEYQLYRRPASWRGLLTAATHSRRALHFARLRGVDLALVSPVFETRSHPGARTLGVHRLARLVRGAGVRFAALGGVKKANAGRLRGLPLAAIAMMDGWN
ncbi:thiamine phosphate synthase [Gimibacter soli]|uniref:Thiamine phosphate synthase n=1 Tax=Gimibacter soli TaxID=3024400 RepID=A0AAE9XTM4_9PROT|nr:thiamine phosphate synthase [Gimibacter soli]WCL54621.1 thiamine phosphate synthase [Gimibacter soli]